MADEIKNTRETKPPAKLLDCVTGVDLDTLLGENQHTNPENVRQLETPIRHTQCDGKTNNVTFQTLRPECWKRSILDHFGPSRASSLKGGTVIKVIFDNNSTIKINFYKSGSVVIQGQKCIQFADGYFDIIKNKLDQNNNNDTSIQNLNASDNSEETIPKILNDTLDDIPVDGKADVSAMSTPIKPPSPKMTVNMESKLTPKDRVLQHSKTIEAKFSEISSILSVIDHTMKTFAEKLAQLKTIKDHMPQSIQSSISSSLNAHKTEITNQWKSIDEKVKHCNGSLDSLHVKSNIFDNHVKQLIEKQTEQSTSIQSLNTLVTGLKERIEQLENHSEGFHITENILPEQNSKHNEKRNISEMDVTTTSDTFDKQN